MSITPYEGQGGEVARYTPMGQSVIALRDWAEAARAAFQVATSLCKTSFVPKEYRGKPEEATAAILAGNEVGLSPIASINAFSPIQGTAAPKAITLRAIVQSRGHEIELLETNANRCVMRGRRYLGSGLFGEWQTVTWTIDRARQLKLTARDQWRNQPQAMLVARATSEIARLVAADAILGIPYSVEEVRDDVLDEAPAAPTATGRARRRGPVQPVVTAESIASGLRAAAERPAQVGGPPLPGEPEYTVDEPAGASPEPAVVDEPDEATADDTAGTDDEPAADEAAGDDGGAFEDAVTEDSGPPTAEDMKRLFALIREADVGDRHHFASTVLHRDVATFHELRAADVERLIGQLERDLSDDETRGKGE